MLIKPCHIHSAVAHDVHHCHQVPGFVHRVGAESVARTVEHHDSEQTCQLLCSVELLLNGLDVTGTTARRRKDEARFVCPQLKGLPDALA